MIRKTAILLVTVCLPVLGDFSYDQTSKITGGMMAGMMKFAGAFSKQAREPMVATVAVKGNRMAHGSQHHVSIIDLDRETITEVNFDKKQYSVMTFAQMKQMMEEMSQKMKSADAQKADAQFKVSVKDTGEKKTIAGFDTHEMVLTMEMEGTDQQTGSKGGMVVTSDMWIAPKTDGYSEIADFYKRMSQKLDWTPGSMGMMGARPDMAKGMSELYKESAKLNGMPVFEVVKMGFHAEGQAQGGQTAQAPPPQQEQQAEKPSIGSVLGGRLGGFGRKKKNEDSGGEGAAPSQGQQGDASGSLIEMTMEMSGFSSAAVDGSKFEIPGGFKQVEPEAAQHRRR
jgi:carbon monoxide dehydrogenase subunit G